MAAINLRVPLGLVPLTNQQVDDNFQNIINALGANGSTTIPTQTGTGGPVLSASPTLTGTLTAANITYTGTLTGGTSVVNIGSNQFYKDASGNIGLGLVPSGTYKLETTGDVSVNSIRTTSVTSTTTGNINNMNIGATTAGTGAFTTLSATGTITANTTTNSQSYTTSGAGTITVTSGTTGNINNMNIGATTRGTGAFTTLGANSTTTLTGAITANTTTNSQSYTTSGAGTITITSGTTGNINNMNIGATTAGTGAFSTLSYTSTLTGGTGIVNIGSGQFYKDASGNVAIGATSSSVKLSIVSTDAIKVPIGTTAERPTGAQGYIRFNSDLIQFEGHNGTAWTSVGGGATGGAGNYIFYENDITVTQNYTITTNKNAMTAGPITVNNGIVVTIPNGSVWTIV